MNHLLQGYKNNPRSNTLRESMVDLLHERKSRGDIHESTSKLNPNLTVGGKIFFRWGFHIEFLFVSSIKSHIK